MKKFLITLASVALLAWAGNAIAADNVASTKHNLSDDAQGTGDISSNEDQICVFCHTPHAGDSTAPLWNRNLPTGGSFTMYTSDTIDMAGSVPGPISLACLSCHDGVTAFNSLINLPGSGTGGTPPVMTGGNVMPAGITRIGTDLRDDHPVGLTYSVGTGSNSDPDFNAINSLTIAKLYNTKVECASCHNPHEDTIATFLRDANAGSVLCLDCHIK